MKNEGIKIMPVLWWRPSYRDDGRWEPVIDSGGAYVDIDISSPSVFIVECSCGAQIVSDVNEETVVDAWNRRI